MGGRHINNEEKPVSNALHFDYSSFSSISSVCERLHIQVLKVDIASNSSVLSSNDSQAFDAEFRPVFRGYQLNQGTF